MQKKTAWMGAAPSSNAAAAAPGGGERLWPEDGSQVVDCLPPSMGERQAVALAFVSEAQLRQLPSSSGPLLYPAAGVTSSAGPPLPGCSVPDGMPSQTRCAPHRAAGARKPLCLACPAAPNRPINLRMPVPIMCAYSFRGSPSVLPPAPPALSMAAAPAADSAPSPTRRSPTISAPIPIHRGNWTSHDIDLATRDLELANSPTLSLSFTSGVSDPSPTSVYVRPDPTYCVAQPAAGAATYCNGVKGASEPVDMAASIGLAGGLAGGFAGVEPSPPGKALYSFVPHTAHRCHTAAQLREHATSRGRLRACSATSDQKRRQASSPLTSGRCDGASGISRSVPDCCTGGLGVSPPPAPRCRPASPQLMPPRLLLPPPSPASETTGLSSSPFSSSAGVSMLATSSPPTPTYVQVRHAPMLSVRAHGIRWHLPSACTRLRLTCLACLSAHHLRLSPLPCAGWLPCRLAGALAPRTRPARARRRGSAAPPQAPRVGGERQGAPPQAERRIRPRALAVGGRRGAPAGAPLLLLLARAAARACRRRCCSSAVALRRRGFGTSSPIRRALHVSFALAAGRGMMDAA